MELAYDCAREQVENLQSSAKKRYDAKVRGAVLSVGDHVLVRKTHSTGRHKIENKWEDEIYIVIGQLNSNIPVYDVKREDKKGRIRRVHRNLLLPINHIGEEMINWNEKKAKSVKNQGNEMSCEIERVSSE